MKRLPDWEARLAACLERLRSAPHVYGKNDCLIGLAAGVIHAVTGRDLARGHRGKYNSQATAVRYLRSIGFGSPEALLDKKLKTKPVGYAGRGDLVLVPGNGEGEWDIPAVCMGGLAYVPAFIYFVDRPDIIPGLYPIPRQLWLKAWAVGDHHSGRCR